MNKHIPWYAPVIPVTHSCHPRAQTTHAHESSIMPCTHVDHPNTTPRWDDVIDAYLHDPNDRSDQTRTRHHARNGIERRTSESHNMACHGNQHPRIHGINVRACHVSLHAMLLPATHLDRSPRRRHKAQRHRIERCIAYGIIISMHRFHTGGASKGVQFFTTCDEHVGRVDEGERGESGERETGDGEGLDMRADM